MKDNTYRTILLVTIVCNIWGFPTTSMVPVIAETVLNINATLLGFLVGAEGAGCLLGSIVIAGIKNKNIQSYLFAIQHMLNPTNILLRKCTLPYIDIKISTVIFIYFIKIGKRDKSDKPDLRNPLVIDDITEIFSREDVSFEIFKKLAIIAPENGRIHLTLADYYREQGDNIKSFEELKLAFKSTKLGIDIKVQILVSYFQLLAVNDSMRQQAEELSELLINTHKDSPKAHAVYADILYTENKFQEAMIHYLIVLEKDKTKSQVWSQVLFIQAEQNDFSGMLEISDKALTYFPVDPIFYYFNGLSNKWLKHNNEAISALEMGIEFVIDNEMLLLEFYSSLADLHHAMGNDNVSDSLYEKVLDIDSENVLVLNNYAYNLSVRKVKLEKAK